MALSVSHAPLKKFTKLHLTALALTVAGMGIASGIVLTANTQSAEAATKCVNKVLKKGNKSTCVKYMQQIVNASGVTGKITANGTFGASTKKAVVKFQKAKKLSADGVVGKGTWNKLCAVKGADTAKKKAGCKSTNGWTHLNTYSASTKDSTTPQITAKYYGCKVKQSDKYSIKTKSVVTYLPSSSPFKGGTIAVFTDYGDMTDPVTISKVGTTARDTSDRLYKGSEVISTGTTFSLKSGKSFYHVPSGTSFEKKIKVSALKNC